MMNIRRTRVIRNLILGSGATIVGLGMTAGSAQAILITPVDSGEGLVNTITWGQNITVIQDSISYTGAEGASGQFLEDGSSIGLNKGIVLTTGQAVDGQGPNEAGNTGTKNEFPGDADLDGLVAPSTTQDAAFLEFDILAEADAALNFKYVFASEEYNEFGNFNFNFNDVTGVFLDGENVAFVPGTTLPVAINNVNGGSPLPPLVGSDPVNEEYFNDNDIPTADPLLDLEYDGFTDVFVINEELTPGNHTVKIAIADVGDNTRDSAIFVETIPEPTSMFGLCGLAYFGFASWRKRKQ